MIDLKVLVHGRAHHHFLVVALPCLYDLILGRKSVTISRHVVELLLSILLDVGLVLLDKLCLDLVALVIDFLFQEHALIELIPVVIQLHFLHSLFKL